MSRKYIHKSPIDKESVLGQIMASEKALTEPMVA